MRSITRDLVAAAQKAAGRDARITIRPEIGKIDHKSHVIADDIFVDLRDAAKRPAVVAALDRAAARNHLSRITRSTSPDLIRFDYLLNGRRTQSVRIAMPNSENANRTGPQSTSAPRLAIIIDDLGSDLAPAETLLKLRYPLTLSILPGQRIPPKSLNRRSAAAIRSCSISPWNSRATPPSPRPSNCALAWARAKSTTCSRTCSKPSRTPLT